MDKKPNIIWLHIDGVRPNKDFGDHKDRPDYLDKFAKESIEYTNIYTAASNTVMSMSSMIAGYPSVYIARSFNEFKYDMGEFKSLFTILKENGYDVYSFIFPRYIRRVFRKAMYAVDPKYYPLGINEHKYKWTSTEVNQIVYNFLRKKKLNDPYLLYIHYGFDPTIEGDKSLRDSRRMLNYLKKRGYLEDSIVIIWSDHGWPAPQTEKNRGRLNQALEGHDLILTDDNVRVPIFIKYPGCDKGIKIHDLGYTLDLGPTVLNLAGINEKFGNPKYSQLLSFKNSNETKQRYLRIDARYFFQNGRKSCLTDGNYKYICYLEDVHKCTKEILFDLKNDPHELINLVDNNKYKKILEQFRKQLIIQEKEIYNYHLKYLNAKLNAKSLNVLKSAKQIYIIASENLLFSKAIYDVLVKQTGQKNIEILNSQTALKLAKNADLVVFALDNPFKRNTDLLKILKLNKINYFYLDQNFDYFVKCTPVSYILENLKQNWKVYITKPKLFGHWLAVFYLRAMGKVA